MVLTGVLVPRPFYTKEVREKEAWKELAFNALGLSRKLSRVAETGAEVFRTLEELATESKDDQ